jgi:hypothetical protein
MQSLTIDKLIANHIFHNITELVIVLLEQAQSSSLTEYYKDLCRATYIEKRDLVPYQFRYLIKEDSEFYSIFYRLDSDNKSERGYQEIPVAIITESPKSEIIEEAPVYSIEKLETEGFDVNDKEEVFNFVFDKSYEGFNHALIWSEKEPPYFHEYSDEVLQHWVVSDWLAKELTKLDETIIRIPSLDRVWCRTSDRDLTEDKLLLTIANC